MQYNETKLLGFFQQRNWSTYVHILLCNSWDGERFVRERLLMFYPDSLTDRNAWCYEYLKCNVWFLYLEWRYTRALPVLLHLDNYSTLLVMDRSRWFAMKRLPPFQRMHYTKCYSPYITLSVTAHTLHSVLQRMHYTQCYSACITLSVTAHTLHSVFQRIHYTQCASAHITLNVTAHTLYSVPGYILVLIKAINGNDKYAHGTRKCEPQVLIS